MLIHFCLFLSLDPGCCEHVCMLYVCIIFRPQNLEPNAVTAVKGNLRKAIAILKQDKSNKEKNDEILKDLIGNLSVFENVSKSSDDSAEVIDACTKARTKVLKVLDEETGEPFSTDSKGRNSVSRNIASRWRSRGLVDL